MCFVCERVLDVWRSSLYVFLALRYFSVAKHACVRTQFCIEGTHSRHHIISYSRFSGAPCKCRVVMELRGRTWFRKRMIQQLQTLIFTLLTKMLHAVCAAKALKIWFAGSLAIAIAFVYFISMSLPAINAPMIQYIVCFCRLCAAAVAHKTFEGAVFPASVLRSRQSFLTFWIFC